MSIFATINLSTGKSIKVELYPDKAPLSVANFVKLAKSGYYTDTIFHRVIKNFMIQGGGMDSTMRAKGKPDTIKGEFTSNGVKNDLKHTKGVLSMARAMDPNSGSSQFFICVVDTPHLDGSYAAFGKTCDEESLKNAVEISKVKTTSVGYYDDVPVDPIIINSITIEEN